MNRRSTVKGEKDLITLNLMVKKENSKDLTKFQEMLGVINRAISKDASSNCRKHDAVYGWVKMNYPSTINRSLFNQLIEKENQTLENILELPEITSNLNRMLTKNDLKNKSELGDGINSNHKLRHINDAHSVNQDVMKESKF